MNADDIVPFDHQRSLVPFAPILVNCLQRLESHIFGKQVYAVAKFRNS